MASCLVWNEVSESHAVTYNMQFGWIIEVLGEVLPFWNGSTICDVRQIKSSRYFLTAGATNATRLDLSWKGSWWILMVPVVFSQRFNNAARNQPHKLGTNRIWGNSWPGYVVLNANDPFNAVNAKKKKRLRIARTIHDRPPHHVCSSTM
jgi:hypothetical protein